MSKKITTVFVGLLLLGFTLTLTGEETRQPYQAREKLRETLEIRQQMRQIEKATIESDPELKVMAEQLKTLHMQMKEKLDKKLSTNTEYQELKKKDENLRTEWKKSRLEGDKPAFKKGRKKGEPRKKNE